MATPVMGAGQDKALEQVLGYLNFSEGAADPQLLANLNRLFAAAKTDREQPVWTHVERLLYEKLKTLQQNSSTFRDSQQATSVLQLQSEFLHAYREFHADLLFHLRHVDLLRPFFIGRVFEAILKQGPPWDDHQRIIASAITCLNDYIGCRPVASLERRKIEPYPHEWLRPMPIYIRGVGVETGPHQEVVEKALELLEATDAQLLQAAQFDPELLDELAVDPRAYDFDHPVNRRPNYHFGQWDPHQIDELAKYRRFVVQQVTLDALMKRVENPGDLPQSEVIFEAAAVLAGTMLMASAISGSGPGAHDSSATLTSLLPEIAACRDAFYEQLFRRLSGEHAQRLRAEAQQRRQPFGTARQHLNAELARLRAVQLEHAYVAIIFARMGLPRAATRQMESVPVATARMRCEIDCQITAATQAVDHGELEQAAESASQIVGLIQRGIHCGALIDPWNILGFHAQFSLFPAVENSVHDHRADELIDSMENLFALFSRIWSAAAASDDQALCQRIDEQFKQTAQWWRQFAVHEVSSVEAFDALDIYRAARHVADALNLWHRGGAAAGDVAFWAKHAEMFDSPKAHALVIDALLEHQDEVASMALLIHWLSQAEQVGLGHGEGAFHELAERWLIGLLNCSSSGTEQPDPDTWSLVKKFFDYLEANADEYGRVPTYQLVEPVPPGELPPLPDEQDEEDLYSAAYESVVYCDTTDDGIDDSLLEGADVSEDELERESRRLRDRLTFLSTLGRLWKHAAAYRARSLRDQDQQNDADLSEALAPWIAHATTNCRDLLQLLDAVNSYQIPKPRGDHDSLVQYDRRRLAKEVILEQIVATCVETIDAARYLLAVGGTNEARESMIHSLGLGKDQLRVMTAMGCLLRGDREGIHEHWEPLNQDLAEQPLLYVPLTKGGNPRRIVLARVRQQSIEDLVTWLPRLGMLTETRELLDTARRMERDHPVGAGAVTEFDELFKIGYKGVVQCLTTSAETWSMSDGEKQTSLLIDYLEKATEALLVSWLAHSRTLRLSVLEKVRNGTDWDELVVFIKQYGSDLFTQKFFNLGNLRAILHEGVDVWLRQLQEDPEEGFDFRLLNALDEELDLEEAVEHLTLVLEAIVENYGEYRDYNSTTTQSDRGQLLYTLLDFLRLRTEYDRVAWNLRPVVWAHEMLVRQSLNDAAKAWRRSLTERISQEADKYIDKLVRLQEKHAMLMPTVADRLGERFIRPMQIDRIRALIEPAIRGAGQDKPPAEFELLEHETTVLARDPTGVGLDVPAWLVALEDEVDQARRRQFQNGATPQAAMPQAAIPLEEVQRQIDKWVQRD